MTIPPGCRTLTDALTLNGWSYALNHSEDYGRPYLDVEARRGDDNLAVTWRTQETSAQLTAYVNGTEATFTKVMQAVTA